MDFLSHFRDDGDGGWAPASEKVLAPTQLVDPPVDRGPGVEAPDSGVARLPAPAAHSRPAPELDDDLDGLGDLTYAELAQMQGVDPAEAEKRIPSSLARIGRLPEPDEVEADGDLMVEGDRVRPLVVAVPVAETPPVVPAPTGRPFTAATRPLAFAAASGPAPTTPVDRSKLIQPMPTWPPPGERADWRPPQGPGKRIGPVPSRHRPDPHRAARQRALFALLVVVAAVASVWYFALRPHHNVPASSAPSVSAPAAAIAGGPSGGPARALPA